MPKLTVGTRVAASPERVFALASDFPGAAERVSGIDRVEMLTEGAVGVGTRFRETRTMFGREASETMEVTAFDPPRSYSLLAESHGCRYLSELRVRPVEGGSEVELVFDARPLTPLARVMSVLMRPLAGLLRKELAKDLADIKRAAEAA